MDACQPPDDLHPRCEDAFAKVRMYAVQPPERAARRAAPQARFGRLYGVSAAMNAVFEMIEKVAPSDASVLLIGESGHRQGTRCQCNTRRERVSRRRLCGH
jgi:DNA-binding NtrC family response regulator